MVVAVVVEFPPEVVNETKGLKILCGNIVEEALFWPNPIFNPIYDIHKHVGNVVLWGYIQKYSSLQDDEGERCYVRKGWKAEVIKY